MKDGFISVAAGTPKIRVADCRYNAEQIFTLMREADKQGVKSDSKYVIDGLEKGWAKGWKARGWKKADKKPALNPDLWDRLLALTEVHSLRYHWVKGHAENAYNNRCDELAVAESQKYK